MHSGTFVHKMANDPPPVPLKAKAKTLKVGCSKAKVIKKEAKETKGMSRAEYARLTLSLFEEKVDRLACQKLQWTGLGECPYAALEEEVAEMRDKIMEMMK